MFEELKQKEQEIAETETPTLGSYGTKTYGEYSLEKKLPDLQVIYRHFNLADENDRLTLEWMMTNSLHCGDELNKPGDLRVINEETTFTKEGDYIVAVKAIKVKEDD